MAPLNVATRGLDSGRLDVSDREHNFVTFPSSQLLEPETSQSTNGTPISTLKLQSRRAIHHLQPRSGSSADEAAVVGVVLGVVFFVVVLLLVAYIYWWRASSIHRQSSSSRRKEKKKRRREKRSKRDRKSEKRYRDRRYDRHRRRRSPSSTSSYYDCNKGPLPCFIDTPQYPPYVAQGNGLWHDDGCFNEMDAPQMTYSDDEVGQFEPHFGRPRFPLEYLSPARQVYRYKGRRRRSRSCSSYS